LRKYKKKILSEMVDTLSEAHDHIYRYVEDGNPGEATQLLGQAQECAVTMGSTIEESEGEGTKTVGCLEKYCEVLFQTAADISDAGEININKIRKNLSKSLVSIENSINNDIRTTTETVFLPYKASMWDSLESIWKKSEADPDDETYVIPIPYCDRNPDGSFGEWHYEGDKYPKDVPVMHYEWYDFEKRRPDRIYIHNPYDEANYVTSVHPFFYSKNLKKFTDELIYIPYFVLPEPDPENDEAVKDIEHFITVPAVMNADKVIVQSENMRRVYINVMVKYTGKEYREYWKNKISGEGSPKFDRILKIMNEEQEIPKEWQEMMTKEDGTKKKVIFYNTGISALLENDMKMIDKIKDSLEIFKKNKENVTLLWRPHPLIQATISSMRPHLWEQYKGIVDRYVKEHWGIYDDSADMDRAIVISDAYYGDMSSIVELYKKTGKPIMIQNAEIIEGV